MSDYLVTDTELTSVANAIRTKGGTSANLSFPTEFVSAINDIPTGKQVKAGKITISSAISSGYVTIETVANLGFTPKYVALFQETISMTANYLILAVCLPRGTNYMQYSWKKVRGGFSFQAATGSNGSGSSGLLGIRNNEIQFYASSDAIIGTGDWYWMAVEGLSK